ncbi:unnamed protein product [Gongylonema pulchrum]|uniref:Tetratricopeptide repeat (TPR)-like superfamily protein n=1 Tax=Gongylonema pulchrum TaxID=637853 RepID=A0A183DQE1_9BILA|nr:unnamed protein product [Gongylonema pulchrum]
MGFSAKEHLERCLKERKNYSVAKAHCRLSSLYADFDPVLTDITELLFNVKWGRTAEAVTTLERIVRTHSSAHSWTVVYELFTKACTVATSTERALFMGISDESFEFVISGVTKRLGNDENSKTKLFLFCLHNADENKFAKLLSRAITFLTERANNDKNQVDGINKYHLYLAIVAAPALLKLNFTSITATRALGIVITVLHVAVAWTEHHDYWIGILSTFSREYVAEAELFLQNGFKIAAALLDKCIDTVLAWISEDNWAMDVDKLLSSSADTVTPSKRPRLKEKKGQLTSSHTNADEKYRNNLIAWMNRSVYGNGLLESGVALVEFREPDTLAMSNFDIFYS